MQTEHGTICRIGVFYDGSFFAYAQRHYYHEREPGWEHVTMEFGRRYPGGGPDPLFGRLFVIAVSINFLPAALGGTPVELAVLAILHLAVIFRVRVARMAAAGQRAADLEKFEAIRASLPRG